MLTVAKSGSLQSRGT